MNNHNRLPPYQQLLAEGMDPQQVELKLGIPSADSKPKRLSPRNTRRVSLERLELKEFRQIQQPEIKE